MPDIKSNLEKWNNNYQWEHNGDEWSKVWGSVDMHWFGSIFPRIHSFLPVRSILEIAPGYGRWTNYLKTYCQKLIAVDLSDKCIEYCKNRFSEDKQVFCYQNDGKSLSVAEDHSVDFVFSYDSLVHVEMDVLEEYFKEISRILSIHGVAFIHHSNRGNYSEVETDPDFHNHWRAKSVTHEKVSDLAKKYRLNCISQELINWSNKPEWTIDCFSIITGFNSRYNRDLQVFKNGNFMIEARQWNPLSKLYDFSYAKLMQQPQVSIIIPLWNKSELTEQCLEAIEKNTKGIDYEIILIDNASTDQTLEVINRFKNRINIKIIQNKENLGFSKANNQGAEIARGKYLVLLNNDTIPQPDWLNYMVQAMETDSQIGITGVKLLYPDDTIQHCGVALRRDRAFFKHPYKYVERSHSLVNSKREWDAVTAACFITLTDLYRGVGGLDESYQNGCEDIDFCCKVKAKGYKVVYEPKAEVYHLESQTPRMQNKDEENFALFIKKWGKFAIKTEHEIFCEDGFWKISNGKYIHNYDNEYFLNWEHLLKQSIDENNEKETKRLNKLLKHLYTVKDWPVEDNPGKRNNNYQSVETIIKKGITEETSQKENEKKKILFVCHDFPPYRYAGAQLYAKNLAQAINKSGLAEVEIFHPVFRELLFPEGYIEKSSFEDLTVYKVYKLKEKRQEECILNLTVEKAFDQFLKEHHYDAIHFHGLGQLSAVPIEIAKKHQIRTIMTLHDYWFICEEWHMIHPDQSLCSGPENIEKCAACLLKYHIPPEKQKDLIKNALIYKKMRKDYFQKCFNMIDVKIAPSKFLKEQFEKYGFKGIENEPLGFIPKSNIKKTKNEKIVFGFAGQIIKRKGIETLINAFDHIPESLAELHIYGQSAHNKFTKKIFDQMQNRSNIKYFGAYVPEDLAGIFSTFDVAIIPSLMENYPLLVQEAFMFKTPVIASKAGGIPEAVTEGLNGLLFNTGDPVDLRNKILQICSDPALKEKLSEGIRPVRNISEDVEYYANLYESGDKPARVSNPVNKNSITIQFYIYKNVHWPMFEELYYYLKTRPEVKEIVLCLPNIINITQNQNDVTLDKILALPDKKVQNPRTMKADITFIADTIAGKVKDCGYIVNLGHGTISKGYYFTESIWTERENWVDMLCVPGNYAKTQFDKILKTRVVATGMPKLDPVFSGRYNKKKLCAQYQLDESKKIVLYAPTFNKDLSSVFDFVDQFKQFDGKDYYVLIKLHGSTIPLVTEQYKDIASQSKNILYIDDSNLAPYIGGADIMISDVSSAFMEFMACDKPVILYNNPHTTSYHGYDPENIEYKWRDLGYCVSSFSECLTLVEKVLNGYDVKSNIRMKYALELFSDHLGKGSENVWKACQNLMIDSKKPKQIPTLSIVLKSDKYIYQITNQLHYLQFYTVMPIEIVLLQYPFDNNESFNRSQMKFNEFHNVQIISCQNSDPFEVKLIEAIHKATGEFIIVLNSANTIYRNFDYLIYKSFILNPEIKAFTGLNDHYHELNYYGNYLSKSEEMLLERFAYDLFNRYQCKEFDSIEFVSLPDFYAFRKKDFPVNDSISEIEFFRRIQENLKVNKSILYKTFNNDDRKVLEFIWDKQHSITAENIKNYIDDLIEINKVYPYPFFAELLLKTLLKGRNINKSDLIGLAYQSLFQRYFDRDYKKELLTIFSEYKIISTNLKKDLTVIELLEGKQRSQEKKRVMLYYFKNVHIPILKPILSLLGQYSNQIDIGIGIMPYAPEIRAGFTDTELREIQSYGLPIFFTPQDYHPDVTVICDSVYPWVQNCGKLIHIGHGILSKGQYYTNTETAKREDQADLICVPGLYHKEIMNRIISKPVIATGMAKLDDLFNGTLYKSKVCRQYNLPDDYKYILFAPTFNDELSAIPYFRDQVAEVLPDDKSILLVKLHGSTKEEYRLLYQNMVEQYPNTAYIDELDITPFLALADIMISDVSSAMVEFAALGKPVILFNNPNQEQYQNYNPTDIEYKFRDLGYQVNNITECKTIIQQLILGNDPLAEKRNEITDLLLENKKDGKATERIIELILKM